MMTRKCNYQFFFLVIFLFVLGCQSNRKETQEIEYSKGSFGYDLAFLNKHKKTIVLKDDLAMIAICPDYQGRVMTSSSSGMDGLSYGWLNYELIESGKKLDHFNPVGGEDRFWLGPEGGQFSIFFAPGASYTLDDWQTPAAIDTEPFQLISSNEKNALFEKTFSIRNYSDQVFDVKVNREIGVMNKNEIEENFPIPDAVNYVAYESRNTITNIGNNPWTESSGALSIWILGMFMPTEMTTVIVPYVTGPEEELGPIVNDTYFGKVPEDRLKVDEEVIFFKADGKYRSKIGLNPNRAKTYMGSYDAKNKVLTIVFFTKPNDVKKYVNSLWELQEQPFAGDVANSYNDGPVEDGSMLGPFYELESSSPAAFLSPDESMTHMHQTIHIEGEEVELNKIVNEIFNIDLDVIKGAF